MLFIVTPHLGFEFSRFFLFFPSQEGGCVSGGVEVRVLRG
jgi:hypothetical protein